MRLINSTHIQRHCDTVQARKIVNMLSRLVTGKLIYAYSKIIRADGTLYYSKVKMKSFNIKDAIKEITNYMQRPYYTYKHFDYKQVLEVLQKVLKDREKYGEMIPESSDTFKDCYVESAKDRVYKTDYVAVQKAKNDKKNKFVKKFNEAEIVWS